MNASTSESRTAVSAVGRARNTSQTDWLNELPQTCAQARDFEHRQQRRPTAHSRPIRMLRLTQVMDVTGLRRSKIYELQAQGDFPKRVKIAERSVGWVEAEVQDWLARRIANK